MKDTTFLFSDNVHLIEDIYNRYRKSNSSVSEHWKQVFDSDLEIVKFAKKSLSEEYDNDFYHKYLAMLANKILDFFRQNGHIFANINPLLPSSEKPSLNFIQSLNEDELLISINDLMLIDLQNPTINQILEKSKEVYCQSIGFECFHVTNDEEREWLHNRIELTQKNNLSIDEKEKIFTDLLETELFEQFLHLKYPGYKRFSIEGAESTIVSLEKIISMSLQNDIQEIVLGMAHRGRLNVLTKIMGKPYTSMLSEFQGRLSYPDDLEVSGDVKYHLGYSCDRKLKDHAVHLTLCSNPSHLEAVNSVSMGRTRAKQNLRKNVLNVLIHGDASFAGQGVVSECLTLTKLSGYQVFGTIHIIINNQIGFTTNPQDSRSSRYCSDIAKSIGIPVLHINGDDPEAVVFATELAVDYRQKFKKDIILDIICYRRHGHNEGDEPMFTQPILYKKISSHITTFNAYKNKLLQDNIITEEKAKSLYTNFRSQLEKSLADSANYSPKAADWFEGCWSKLHRPIPGNFTDYLTDSGVNKKEILKVLEKLTKLPENFTSNTKITKLLENRLTSAVNNNSIDWGTAETLAFASLLMEKVAIRLSGQDSARGTFSHRHSKLVDQLTGDTYIPLNNISPTQEKFEVIDSPLSEYAVMGFEYGYSLDSPNALTIWEGQFGDFANGAQIIIDQFISSAESKWLRSSGLVLLLPHGYEGQGPEHSSARIERYLQLCAEDNMQVVNCTTPANYFHALRRQIHRNFRKPLIIFTPKSLLRHKLAVSKLEELTTSFMAIIPETDLLERNSIKKLVLCSGKIYYDIVEYRKNNNIMNVAVIRLEQFYPFPILQLRSEICSYKNLQEIVWCQEEPLNMGGWFFVNHNLENSLEDIEYKKLKCISRPPSSSPASGYSNIHSQQQNDILSSLFI